MFRLRSPLSLGLLLPLLAWAVPAAAQGAAVRTVDARQLLAIAKGGLTAMAAAAGSAGGPLAPGAAQNRPFWAAIDAMGHSLDTVEAAFLARNPAFFAALGDGSRTLAELKAVWAHSAPASPATTAVTAAVAGVASGLETLSAAYLLLRGSYGWEVLRRQQGGALTAAEADRLQALKRAQAVLASRLTAVRTQAVRAGDTQTATDLGRLIAQAQSIAAANLTLAAYLAALQAAEALQGEWKGDAQYAQPAVKKALKKSAPLVEDLTTDPGVGFVFTTDLSQADSWTPLAAPVEVPAGVDLGPEAGTLPAADTAADVATAANTADAQPLSLDPAPSDPAEGEGAETAAAVPEAPPATDDKAGKEKAGDPKPAPAPALAAPLSPAAPVSPASPVSPAPAPAPPPASPAT